MPELPDGRKGWTVKCFVTAMPSPRLVMLGLLLSALGGLCLVTLASAHERPGVEGPRGMAPAGGSEAPGPLLPPLAGPHADHLLELVAATPQQRERIRQIMATTRTEALPDEAAWRADRARLETLFAAPQVDAAAVESLRQARAVRQDALARRMTAAAVEAANVLDAAQRQRLLQALARGPADRRAGPAPAASQP